MPWYNLPKNNINQKVVNIQVKRATLRMISYFVSHWTTSTILCGAFQQPNEEMWIKAPVLHQKYIKKCNRLDACPGSYCNLAKIIKKKSVSSKNQIY